MFDKKYEEKVRAQEMALFGGCVEDPKYSHGDPGVGFATHRDFRKSTPKSSLVEREEQDNLFEVRYDPETGHFKCIPISGKKNENDHLYPDYFDSCVGDLHDPFLSKTKGVE